MGPRDPGGRDRALGVGFDRKDVRAGELVTLEVKIAMAEGWHLYGSKQDPDLGIPVSLAVEKGVLVPEGVADIPEGEPHEIAGNTYYTLEGAFTLRQKLRVPKGAKPGEAIPIALVVEYMACDESSCDEPVKAKVGAKLMVVEGKAVVTGSETDGDIRELGLLEYIFLAIGAGLFALVMPCTYPMIPITVSFFTKQAEKKGGHVLSLALLYGAGITVSFVIVGVAVGPVIADFAVDPWLNLVLALLFIFFALSLFGLLKLEPPQFLLNTANKASSVGGPIGVFLMGMTLCITSFACTAPFIGTMLAAGGQMGAAKTALGMGVFGLTMATPFVFLSLVPSKLPKSGGWMNTAKVLFAFIELAAALKFLSIADVSWNLQALPRELFLAIWFALIMTAAVYLLGMIRLEGETSGIGPGRFVTGIAFAVLGIYFGYGALGYKLDNDIMVAFEPPYRAEKFAPDFAQGEMGVAQHTVIEDDYDKALGEARKKDKLLLVNITGHN